MNLYAVKDRKRTVTCQKHSFTTIHLIKGRPCDPEGRSMDGWTYYVEVTSFHRSNFENVQARRFGGGSAIAPLRLCEAEGLPAGSLSGFLRPLQRVTSPGPSRRHMDHLNDLSTGSVEADESTQKQRTGQRLCNHSYCLRFSSFQERRSAPFNWILIKLPGERARYWIFAEQVCACFLVGMAHCAVLHTFLKPFHSNIMFFLMAKLHMHFN